MQIVIDIPENVITTLQDRNMSDEDIAGWYESYVIYCLEYNEEFGNAGALYHDGGFFDWLAGVEM